MSELKRKVVLLETQKMQFEVEVARLNAALGDSKGGTEVIGGSTSEEHHHLIKLANRDLDLGHLNEKDFKFLRNYVSSLVQQIEEYESEETTIHQERTSYQFQNEDGSNNENDVFNLKSKIQTLQSRITYLEFELSSRDGVIKRLKNLSSSENISPLKIENGFNFGEIETEKTEIITEDSADEDLRIILESGNQQRRISIEVESMATHDVMHWHLGKKIGTEKAGTGVGVIDDFVESTMVDGQMVASGSMYSEGMQEVKTQSEVKKSVTKQFSDVTKSGTKEFSSVTKK